MFYLQILLQNANDLLVLALYDNVRTSSFYIVNINGFCLTTTAKRLTTCALKNRPFAGYAADGFNALQLVLSLELQLIRSNQMGLPRGSLR